MGKPNREILIVDDDRPTAMILGKILESAGFKSVLASGVSEALEAIRTRVPHLVILDLHLGKDSGLAYLDTHRSIPGMSGVPVIVHSGSRDRNVVYQAMSLGVDDYIAKPVDANVLIQKVKKALKDNGFQKIMIPVGPRSEAVLTATGRIVQANETGLKLEMPLRICEGVCVRIFSPFLELLKCTSAVFQRTRSPAVPSSEGQYRNEVSVVGISPAAALRIRQIMREWQ